MRFAQYAATTSGRVASASGAIALWGGGIAVMSGVTRGSMFTLTVCISLAVGGFITALVLGIRQAPAYLLMGITALPPVAGVYFALVQSWRAGESAPAAIVLLGAGAIAAGLALFARPRPE